MDGHENGGGICIHVDDQAPAFRGTADQMIYVATIDYGFGSESLPLYVSTSIATASMTVNGAASTMPLTVGESSEPSMLPQPTNVMEYSECGSNRLYRELDSPNCHDWHRWLLRHV